MRARNQQRVRLVGELLGCLLVLAALYPICLLWVHGATLDPIQQDLTLYGAATAAGCLGLLAVTLGAKRLVGPCTRRTLFDLWLLTFPLAAGATCALLVLSWPIDLQGWDGHGAGATGAEANVILLPWLHAAIWIGVGRAHLRLRTR